MRESLPNTRPAKVRQIHKSYCPQNPNPTQLINSNSNLPTPHSADLIGRTSEKALLTREWKNRGKRNILALIAEGGTGKSFLVSRWLAELKDKKPAPYAGAQRIFTWSFYSQGSKGQVTSSEGFFSDLLRSFGENPENYDSLGRADKALDLVGRQTMILVLLGRYLADVIGDGDIRKHDNVKLLYAHIDGAEKAKAMLRAYADWFGAKSAETAMLHLLGLFDRPVPMAALRALVAEPVIAGLTEPFHDADAPPLNMVLKRLEDLKLITRPDAETVDGHPLVREHFGAELEKKSRKGWEQAHSRLFDYFCNIPKVDQPDDEAGLMPLYQSLHHGVAAGRAQEALVEVYYRRISRGDRAYGVTGLGLFSTELAALAAFFPGGWQTPA